MRFKATQCIAAHVEARLLKIVSWSKKVAHEGKNTAVILSSLNRVSRED